MSERDRFPECPRCHVALDARGTRWVCTRCHGILIADAEVSQMVADIVGDTLSHFGWKGKIAEPQPLELQPRTVAADDALTCPRCVATMEGHVLYGLDVDRCPAHGVWFDHQELENALQIASGAGRLSSRGETAFGIIASAALLAAYVLQFVLG